MRCTVSFTLALLLALPALAADPPTIERGETSTHSSACALAESMAGKLGFKNKLAADQAQHTCTMLAPTMSDSERAEFVRCCVNRLAGSSAPASQPKAKAKTHPGI